MRDSMSILSIVDINNANIIAYTGILGTDCGNGKIYASNSIPNYALCDTVKFGKGTITSVIVPTNLNSIGNYAFYNSSIISVTIPETVTSIGLDPFKSQSNVSINVDANNANYSSIDGVLYNKLQTILIKCPNAYIGSIIIPSTVTTFERAFSDCRKVTSVTIPSSVDTIEYSAFENCINLTTITIPTSIKLIGYNAFNRSGLLTVNIPQSVTKIEGSAFESCASLTNLTIPNSVTYIGDYAFKDCSGLESINCNLNSPIDLSSIYDVFYGINKTSCVLHVPIGTTSTFKAAYQWKDFKNITDTQTGIKNEINESISIFPNPTTSSFLINITGTSFIEIYNLIGELVLSSTISEKENINVSELKTGSYYVKIYSGNSVSTKTLIKE
jgi:hypothetical protein